jgi:hypothetical protein
MKELIRNAMHVEGKSHDCLIKEYNGKKVKFTYEAYNAVERCTTELFDGYKWNPVIHMLDIAVKPETSAYIWDSTKRMQRADGLFKDSERMLLTFI